MCALVGTQARCLDRRLTSSHARCYGPQPLLHINRRNHRCEVQSPLHTRCAPHLSPFACRRTSSAAASCLCRSVPETGSAAIEPLPEGLQIAVKPESTNADGKPDTSVEYDEANKVVRIPLAALQGPEGSRRTKLVMFTCNKCGGRTARLVNPVAWEKGVVFGQCGTCEVWHVLSANNKKVFEEVRYNEDPEWKDK